MNVALFYFSGTGNTAWAAFELERLMEQAGFTFSAYAIDAKLSDAVLTDVLKKSDRFGFAYPLYGANIPRVMRAFIIRFVQISKAVGTENKQLFFINTFAYVNGHGVFNAVRLFKGTGLQTIGYINLKVANSAPSKTKPRPPLGEAMPEAMKQKVSRRLSSFIQQMKRGKKRICGIGPHLLVGIIIRRLLRDEIRDNYLNMKVDKTKCTGCMQCVKHCPVSCITYKAGEFQFSSACEACMRCFNQCPTAAIYNR